MVDNVSQGTPEQTNVQEKVLSTLSQPQPDANSTEQSFDNKKTEIEGDENFKAFREARKKDRAEREAAEKRAADKEAEVAALKAAMEAAFAKGSPAPQQQQYDYQYQQEETEEDRIKRLVEDQISKRDAILARERAEREQREYPDRLVRSYPDFNNTITPENLDYLEFHHPEVARPLKRLGDDYDKWSDVYHAIKKFVPNATNAKRESARADANFNKPRSMSNTGLTQDTQAPVSTRLSEERRAENWARMQRISKGVG